MGGTGGVDRESDGDSVRLLEHTIMPIKNTNLKAIKLNKLAITQVNSSINEELCSNCCSILMQGR